MRLVATLAAYAFAIGILFSGLIGGAMWLVTPDSAISREARSAPVPPRIADSIERKKPVPVEEKAPEPVKPLQQANVSLTPAVAHSPAIRLRSASPKPKRKPHHEREAAQAPSLPSPAPEAPVSTARSDFPY